MITPPIVSLLPSGAGCSEAGFGSCVVTDAAVAGQCPYSLLLEQLADEQLPGGTTYYIRVAAIGDVAAQAVNPTGDPPDNTNWSGVLEAVPVNQPPSSPGPVSIFVLDGSTLQLHMEIPAESGGSDITQYIIEVDGVSTFSSTDLVKNITVEADAVSWRKDEDLIHICIFLFFCVPSRIPALVHRASSAFNLHVLTSHSSLHGIRRLALNRFSWGRYTTEAALSTTSPISSRAHSTTCAFRRFRRWERLTPRSQPTTPSHPASIPVLRLPWRRKQ